MKVGIFADTHDHLDHIRLAVARLNAEQVDLVLFAGDFVSTIALPPLKKLAAPLVACFGDNEGNRLGLFAGISLIGELSDPPVHYTSADNTRFVIAHMKRQLRGIGDDFDIAIYGHTHKPRVDRDEQGRLWINPGETSGWSFGRPSIAILETTTREVRILDLLPRPSAVAATS